MGKVVIIKIREVYGTPLAYPQNQEAKRFAAIAGTKTLTLRALAIIKELGFELVIEGQQVEGM